MGVEPGVALLLPAVGVQLLAEVPLLVEEAHAHERHTHTAGRLEVVAGQHPEAARVLRERLRDAEFRGEVRHRAQRGRPALEPAGALDVAEQFLVDLDHESHEARVGRHRLEALPGHVAEEAHRVMAGLLPGVGVEPPEQIPGALVPGPAEIERQGVQGGERLGEPGPDRETSQCLHEAKTLPNREPLNFKGLPGAGNRPKKEENPPLRRTAKRTRASPRPGPTR